MTYHNVVPLQVWIGGHAVLAGHLTNVDGIGTRFILINRSSIDEYGGVIDEEREFTLRERQASIDMELVRDSLLPVAKLDCKIPDNAAWRDDGARDQRDFSWFVLVVSLEDYEWIFDLEDFEPCEEGQPDMEAKLRDAADQLRLQANWGMGLMRASSVINVNASVT